jgi:hypothetical protein
VSAPELAALIAGKRLKRSRRAREMKVKKKRKGKGRRLLMVGSRKGTSQIRLRMTTTTLIGSRGREGRRGNRWLQRVGNSSRREEQVVWSSAQRALSQASRSVQGKRGGRVVLLEVVQGSQLLLSGGSEIGRRTGRRIQRHM